MSQQAHRTVLLITLPHTGTHFLRTFLEEAPGVDQRVNVGQVFAHGSSVIPEGVTVLWGHYDHDGWPSVVPIIQTVRPIVPMRDPLRVGVSHAIRGTKMRVDTWVEAVSALDDADAHYIALDRPNTADGRAADLMACLSVAGFDATTEAREHVRAWAKEWPLHHHNFGEAPLKDAYVAGDFDTLVGAMPDTVAALQKNERIFRPWLERMGYERLMWWS